MKKRLIAMIHSAMLLTLASGSGVAQQTPGLPADKASQAEQDNRFERWRAALPMVTGPYAVERIVDALSTHTIYVPKDLNAVPGGLPIVSFGNGGCRNTSIEFTAFLAEIASRGFFVIAAGRNDVEFGTGAISGTSSNGQPLQISDAQQLMRGVDWAVTENARPSSHFFGKLDTKAVAYMGQSCGGIQALTASADPRTSTTVVLNSSYLDPLPPNLPKGLLPEQLPYSSLHAPIAFFIGGPSDVAYGPSKNEFKKITKLPVFIANLEVGHTGAYADPNLKWTNAVVAWLRWRLGGDSIASKQFIGKECGLCKDPAWTEVDSKLLK